MATYSAQTSTNNNVRRSKRLEVFVPVLVYGTDRSGAPFRELTRTLSLSVKGALLALAAELREGQPVFVENKNTLQQQECRVVYVGPRKNEKRAVGVEFARTASEFWEVYFPLQRR